jgi:hypothetical protein
VLLVLVVALAVPQASGLQMQLWRNAGQGGESENSTIPSLSSFTFPASLQNQTFSALICGSVSSTLPAFALLPLPCEAPTLSNGRA